MTTDLTPEALAAVEVADIVTLTDRHGQQLMVSRLASGYLISSSWPVELDDHNRQALIRALGGMPVVPEETAQQQIAALTVALEDALREAGRQRARAEAAEELLRDADAIEQHLRQIAKREA